MPISYVGFLKTYIFSLRRLIVVCFYCSLYKSNIYSFNPASMTRFHRASLLSVEVVF